MVAALRLVAEHGAALPAEDAVERMPPPEDLLEHFTAPEGESKKDRERRLARERKRKQRQREDLAKVQAEAVKVPLELYQGTVKALQAVIEAGGFSGPQAAEEAITLLLHGAADLAGRDRHAFDQLIAPPSRSGGGHA